MIRESTNSYHNMIAPLMPFLPLRTEDEDLLSSAADRYVEIERADARLSTEGRGQETIYFGRISLAGGTSP